MKPSKQERQEAARRRKTIAPQLEAYSKLRAVLWPLVTVASRPDFANGVVTTDSRGHRMTRVGAEIARSDAAPEDAAFLLGGSYSFGVGASDDSGTLAAALWRRTGSPYVNLAIRTGSSTQELIAALPFADRTATFVVCSGINNLASAGRGPGLDPLFGPQFVDVYLRELAARPVRELARLSGNPLATFDDIALLVELGHRLTARLRRRLAWIRKQPAAPAPRRRKPGRGSPNEVTASAADRQLRDLRALRRLVPDEATVVFALQPFAAKVEKQWSSEEDEIFAALDVVQGRQWRMMKRLLLTHWDAYAAMLERGCAELGVPFVDLSQATYTGWCFVDRIHMTDRGYDAAAAAIEALLPLRERLHHASSAAEPRREFEPSVPAAPDRGGEDDLIDGEEDPNVYPLW
jgi:hypothetical protein